MVVGWQTNSARLRCVDTNHAVVVNDSIPLTLDLALLDEQSTVVAVIWLRIEDVYDDADLDTTKQVWEHMLEIRLRWCRMPSC